ncbi:unnamed protein product [Plutella xylostella]|uniref:(diamondback moth) hypothetical protein n=1 Tax=Plutella xylostella TaxID=51655 RepID=A0A8S4FVF6_PLUXY|nr:unnamed protein product [Plutella xylostella]
MAIKQLSNKSLNYFKQCLIKSLNKVWMGFHRLCTKLY